MVVVTIIIIFKVEIQIVFYRDQLMINNLQQLFTFPVHFVHHKNMFHLLISTSNIMNISHNSTGLVLKKIMMKLQSY